MCRGSVGGRGVPHHRGPPTEGHGGPDGGARPIHQQAAHECGYDRRHNGHRPKDHVDALLGRPKQLCGRLQAEPEPLEVCGVKSDARFCHEPGS